jgi:hypothetical protein
MQDYKQYQEKIAVDQKMRSMTLGDVGGCQPIKQSYFESLRSCASHAGEVRNLAVELLQLITGPGPSNAKDQVGPMPPDHLKFALDHFPDVIHNELDSLMETLGQIRRELRL